MNQVNAITPMQMKLYLKHYEENEIPEGRYIAQSSIEGDRMFIALHQSKTGCFIEGFGSYLEALLWVQS